MQRLNSIHACDSLARVQGPRLRTCERSVQAGIESEDDSEQRITHAGKFLIEHRLHSGSIPGARIMKILLVDTETTGMWQRGKAIAHPSQPDLAQLAAARFITEAPAGKWLCLDEYDTLVKPSSFTAPVMGRKQEWRMESGAQAVHELSHEKCESQGVSLADALRALYALSRDADLIVAYNADFDRNVLHRALLRLHGSLPTPSRNVDGVIRKGVSVPYRHDLGWWDPMRTMTGICKIPHPKKGRYRGDRFKWPTLQEAFVHCTGGQTFEGAHDAMGDVRALATVVRWCFERGLVPGSKEE